MRTPDAPLDDLKPLSWLVRGRALSLERVLIMGIVNVTPDSFSDGGRYFDRDAAMAHARRLIDEGADIVDIGGESTRPGAAGVSAGEQIRRIVPLIEALSATGVPLSADTSEPDVMQAALRAGASIINDVRALQTLGALDMVAGSDCGVVLMHMQGTPGMMQRAPHYRDVVTEVTGFLCDRIDAATARGVDKRRIAIDPGFGFGKSEAHNYRLLRELASLRTLQCPLLVGLSRKRMLGVARLRPTESRSTAPADRTAASIAAALLAVERGANIVRVHDVAATRDALNVLQALQTSLMEAASA